MMLTRYPGYQDPFLLSENVGLSAYLVTWSGLVELEVFVVSTGNLTAQLSNTYLLCTITKFLLHVKCFLLPDLHEYGSPSFLPLIPS